MDSREDRPAKRTGAMPGPRLRRPIDRDKLAEARLGADLTFRALSERCKKLGLSIDHGNLAKYEKGDRNPSLRTLVVLAKALGVEPGDLLARTPAKAGAA